MDIKEIGVIQVQGFENMGQSNHASQPLIESPPHHYFNVVLEDTLCMGLLLNYINVSKDTGNILPSALTHP